MAAVADPSTVIACVPSTIPQEIRANHFALGRRLLTEIAEQREPLPNGYAFRLPITALSSIAQFVENERKCCPFMQFDISIEPASGMISLRMTGPEGTREIIEAELNVSACNLTGCECSE